MTTLISTELTQKVKENYDLINQELEKISAIHDQTYKTSCNFRYNPTNSYSEVCIDDCTEIKSLINVYAFVKNKEQDYTDAANELKIKTAPLFKWCGYRVEDWKHDIELRITILTQKEKIDKLKKWQRKLEDFLSEEDKLNGMLEELGQDLPF